MECLTEIEERFNEIDMLADLAASMLSDPTKRVTGNAITRSAVVLLSGYFEGGVRDLAEEFVDVVNDSKICISKIPEAMLCILAEEAVDSFKQKKNKLALLSEKIRGGGHIEFNKKKYVKTNANPSVDNLEVLFSVFGLGNIIDELSIRDYGVDSTYTAESQITEQLKEQIEIAIASRGGSAGDLMPEICGAIESKWAPKRKRRKVGYVSEIEELLKKRNRIAHGEGREQVTPEELRRYKEGISKLTKGINEMLDVTLMALVAANDQE